MARTPKEPTSTLKAAGAIRRCAGDDAVRPDFTAAGRAGAHGWPGWLGFWPAQHFVQLVRNLLSRIRHGFFVLVSESTLVDFKLNWDGSGSVTYTVESWRLPITWAGYATPPLVGAVLYWEAHGRGGLETQGTLVVLRVDDWRRNPVVAQGRRCIHHHHCRDFGGKPAGRRSVVCVQHWPACTRRLGATHSCCDLADRGGFGRSGISWVWESHPMPLRWPAFTCCRSLCGC